jgi:hypothetical protein
LIGSDPGKSLESVESPRLSFVEVVVRIGSSLLLIVVGAILKFAVATQQSHGVNLAVIGVILMVAGVVGLLITLAFMTARRRTDVEYHRGGASYVESGPRSGSPGDPVR